MKFRRIAALGIVLTLLAGTAYAEGVERSEENPDTLIITGQLEEVMPGSRVTMIVFAQGNSFADITEYGEEARGTLACVLTAEAGNGGSYRFVWEPVDIGGYDFIISADGVEADRFEFYFLPEQLEATLKEVVANGSQTELETVFADEKNVQAMQLDTAVYETLKDKGKVGSILYGLRSGGKALDYFPLACALCAVKEQPLAEKMDLLVEELGKSGLSFAGENVYQTAASQAVKRNVGERLNLEISGEGTFEPGGVLTEALILAGVAVSENWTNARPFLKLLNNQKYNQNETEIARAVIGKQFDTVAALERYINGYTIETASGGGTGGGSGPGGRGDRVTTGTLPAPQVSFSPMPTATPKSEFSDLDASHWAYESVKTLHEAGIVKGDENGRFMPDAPVTRAELVKMLCGVWNIPKGTAVVFEDVGQQDWFYPYIGGAYENGLIRGDGARFYPNNAVTRQDMAVMMYRSLQAANVTLPEGTLPFEDRGQIAVYAQEAVGALCAAGIVNGISAQIFAPGEVATRAQAAAALERMRQEGVMQND